MSTDELPMSERWRRYDAVVAARPEAFRNPHPDGVCLLLDPGQRATAEAGIEARFRKQGHDPAWARGGLYYEDPWLWMVRDITRFPDGSFHPYHRLILKGGELGVVVIPLYEDRFVLVEHYRNGIRDWSWEFPRGGPEPGLDTRELATLELGEELGGRVESLVQVGAYADNSGVFTVTMHAYVGVLSGIGQPRTEEGIRSLVHLSRAELEDAIRDGRIKDGNTIAAFQIASLMGAV